MSTNQHNYASFMKKLLEKLMYTALKQSQNVPKASCGTQVGILTVANTAVYLAVPGIVENLLKYGFAEFHTAMEVNVSVPNTDLSRLPLRVKVKYTIDDLLNDDLDAKALVAAKEALADSFSQKVLSSMYLRDIQLIIVG